MRQLLQVSAGHCICLHRGWGPPEQELSSPKCFAGVVLRWETRDFSHPPF